MIGSVALSPKPEEVHMMSCRLILFSTTFLRKVYVEAGLKTVRA